MCIRMESVDLTRDEESAGEDERGCLYMAPVGAATICRHYRLWDNMRQPNVVLQVHPQMGIADGLVTLVYTPATNAASQHTNRYC